MDGWRMQKIFVTQDGERTTTPTSDEKDANQHELMIITAPLQIVVSSAFVPCRGKV